MALKMGAGHDLIKRATAYGRLSTEDLSSVGVRMSGP